MDGKTALIVIDARQEYFAPLGKLPLPEGPRAVAHIARAGMGTPSSNPGLPRRARARPGAAIFAPGSPALAVHPEAAPTAGESIITKHLPGAFTATPLEAELRGLGIERVIVSGFMT